MNTPQPQAADRGSYAPVNGINLYYEVHGQGIPIVLLHGGLGTVAMYSSLLPALAASRQVIAVELRGHGHSSLGDAPLTFETMADDVFALLQTLGIQQADVCGYSLGGEVAQQVAYRHPEAVRKLVVVSAACKRNGWHPEVLAGFDRMDAETGRSWVGSPLYQEYAAVAPHPEDWPELIGRVGALLRQDYDWSAQAAALKAPALIVVGDSDAVDPAHAVEFFNLLGGGLRDVGWDEAGMVRSRLAVLPATSHYATFSSPALPPIISVFLDAS